MAEPLGEREVDDRGSWTSHRATRKFTVPHVGNGRAAMFVNGMFAPVARSYVRLAFTVVRRLLASAAGVGVVDLQRRLRADLPLHPDGRLMRIGRLASRVVDLLRQRAERAVGRAVDDVAGVLERLLEARLRAVEPAEEVVADSREVVAAIERDLVLEAVQVALGLLHAVVGRKGIEQPVLHHGWPSCRPPCRQIRCAVRSWSFQSAGRPATTA